MIPDPVIIVAYGLVCAALGFLAAALLARGKAREAERRAWREADRLHHARAIQDRRDATSARIPFA